MTSALAQALVLPDARGKRPPAFASIAGMRRDVCFHLVATRVAYGMILSVQTQIDSMLTLSILHLCFRCQIQFALS